MQQTWSLKAWTQLKRVNEIIDPWIPVSIERLPWRVILDGGVEVTVACPLGAAVEIEEAQDRGGWYIEAAR